MIQAHCSEKQAIRSKNLYFLYVIDRFSPFFLPMSKLLQSLFTHTLFVKERHVQFAQVAHDKRVTVSNLLTLLFTKEQQEQFALLHQGIDLSLTKNERIARKPISELPTSISCYSDFDAKAKNQGASQCYDFLCVLNSFYLRGWGVLCLSPAPLLPSPCHPVFLPVSLSPCLSPVSMPVSLSPKC